MTATRRLKTVAEVSISNVDKKSADGEVAVLLCNYTDVYYNARITSDLPFMEATATVDQIRKFGLRQGDVLLTKDSETSEDIAVPALVVDDLPGVVCGYHLALVRPDPLLVDSRYLYWVLASTPSRQHCSVAATGVTRYGLRTDSLGSMVLPLPDRMRQWAIADFLDAETARIDTLIAAKRRVIELVEERRISLSDLWVEGLFKRFGSIPLRHLLVRIEQGWSPQCDGIAAETGEWGVLKTSAVSSEMFRPGENKGLPTDVEADLRWTVRDGDLLVIRGSGSAAMVGQAAVAEPAGRLLMLSDLIYRLVYKDGSPYFLAAVLRSRRCRSVLESCIRSDAGQTLKLRNEDLKDCPVPAAPAEEQERAWQSIRMQLAPISRMKSRLENQIALLRERRQALITAAVTGQLDIPTAAA